MVSQAKHDWTHQARWYSWDSNHQTWGVTVNLKHWYWRSKTHHFVGMQCDTRQYMRYDFGWSKTFLVVGKPVFRDPRPIKTPSRRREAWCSLPLPALASVWVILKDVPWQSPVFSCGKNSPLFHESSVNHHFVPPEGSLSEAKSVICQMCLPLLRDSTGPITRSKMPLWSYTKRLYNLLLYNNIFTYIYILYTTIFYSIL